MILPSISPAEIVKRFIDANERLDALLERNRALVAARLAELGLDPEAAE